MRGVQNTLIYVQVHYEQIVFSHEHIICYADTEYNSYCTRRSTIIISSTNFGVVNIHTSCERGEWKNLQKQRCEDLSFPPTIIAHSCSYND